MADPIVSRSSDIEFYSGLMPLIRIKIISKSLSKSNSLFEFLRKFSRDEYTVLLYTILLLSDLYNFLSRLQLINLISFSWNINAAWIHNPENPEKFGDKF